VLGELIAGLLFGPTAVDILHAPFVTNSHFTFPNRSQFSCCMTTRMRSGCPLLREIFIQSLWLYGISALFLADQSGSISVRRAT
jgi:hypothetical protein